MRFGELVRITKGRKPEVIVDAPAAGYRRLLQIDDLRDNAVLKYSPPAWGEVLASPADVVIAWDGANAGTSRHGLVGAIGSTLARLRPVSDGIWTPFLGHFLKANAKALREACKGATVPHIDGRMLANLAISLPTLPEQRRIAEVLDRAETLRAQRRQAVAQLDALAEAIFHDLLVSAHTSGWPRMKVGDIAKSMRTGPFGSQLLHSEFVDEGIAVLGIDNVVRNEFVWAQPRFITPAKFAQLNRYRVFPGDVLITIMGTCGRCAIVPADVPVAINTKHLCCITLDETRCLPEYLQSAFLLHPSVRYQLGVHERGAVMPGLNMQLIRDVELPLPPLPVQTQLKVGLHSVSSQKRVFRASASELDALFASLQHRAFRGEL